MVTEVMSGRLKASPSDLEAHKAGTKLLVLVPAFLLTLFVLAHAVYLLSFALGTYYEKNF